MNFSINLGHERDFTSVISDAYDKFSTLLNVGRGPMVSLKTFDTRFLQKPQGSSLFRQSRIAPVLSCVDVN